MTIGRGWLDGLAKVGRQTGKVLVGMAMASALTLPRYALADPVENAPAPPAQVKGLGNTQIDLQNGAFTRDIPIETPEYHGVTPHLSLHYSSSGGNDFVGVGWQVSGFSVIERDYFGGKPRYVLDGEPLVTDYSGAYKTIRQPFDRISQYGNGWQVIRPDGVVMTYGPVFTNSQDVQSTGSFRWGLTQVTDGYGNTANYSWSCTNASSNYSDKLQCNPGSVSYAGITVTFNADTQTRPDQATFATGGPIIGLLTQRLASVVVTVAGVADRNYQLAYQTSTRTGRSLLKSVQVSGGAITLPATTFTWSDLPYGFSSEQDLSNVYPFSWSLWEGAQTFTGDFNGDGREDLIVRTYDKSAVYMLQGSPSGFLPAVNITAQLGASNILGSGNNLLPFTSIFVGDFNGDGKKDLLLLVPYSQVAINYQQYHAYLLTATATSNGSTFFNAPAEVTNYIGMTPYQLGTGRVIVADFDGDGRDDLLFPDVNNADTSGPNYPTYWAEVATANATGQFNHAVTIPSQSAMAQGDWNLSQLTALDLNGDGRNEILARVQTSAGPAQRAVLFPEPPVGSIGVPLFSNGVDVTNSWGMNKDIWQCSTVTPGDFNGDGHTDLLVQQSRSCYAIGPTEPTYLLYANGDYDAPSYSTHESFADKIDVTNITGMNDDKWRNADLFTGDFDGDGKTDLLLRRAYDPTYPGNDTLMLRSTGNGFQPPVVITNAYGMSYDKWTDIIRIGDFNGDGIDDIFVQADAALNTTGGIRPLILATSDPGNVIKGVANGYGATTAVTYVPSTNWVNTNNPPKMQTVTSVTVADGKGTDPTQITDYTYSGAAWDPIERRALGFNYVQATYPNDPMHTYEQSHFYQGPAYESGELHEHYLYGQGGVTLTHTVRTVTTSSSSAPWVSNLTEQDDTGCDSGANCKTVAKTYSYDPYGDVTAVVEQGDTSVSGDERATTYGYTTIGNRVNAISDLAVRQGSAAGAVLKETQFTNFTPGGDGQTIESWLSTRSPSPWVTSFATYDNYGNKTSDKDALGHQTSTAWATSYGRLPSSTTNAAQQTTTFSPNLPCSAQASMLDPNGGLTSWTYDGLCRKQTELRPDSGQTTWSYNLYGSPTSQYNQTAISDPQGDSQWVESLFDGLGREYESKNNAGDVVQTTYDARGLVSSVSAPGTGTGGPVTNYTYDGRLRLTGTSFPGGTSQSSIYNGWVTTTTDEAGKTRTLTRDAYGQVRQVVESVTSTKPCVNGATAYVTTIKYDLLGHQTGHTDACSNISATTFDSLGRVVSRKDPDMGTWTYTYDDAGRMTTQKDAKGQVITSTYDALNRLLGTTNNKDAGSTTFTYDQSAHFPLGRMTTATRASAGGYSVTTSYDYDVMGHAISQTDAIGTRSYATASTFDGMGHVRTMTYPNNEKLTYTYDSRGLQSSLKSSAFTARLVSTASYDPRRNPVSTTLGNGVVETYAYDPNRFWLTGVSASLGTTPVHGVTLGRDGRGLVMTRANALDPTDNWTYTYDGVRRLTNAKDTGKGAWTEAFTYDPINRVITSSKLGTYSYPAAGSPHADAPQTIVSPSSVTTTNTYDTNGNLLTSGTNSLTYDVENRPTQVNGQETGYDAAGTRVFQGPIDFIGGDTYEFDSSTSVPTRYYYFDGRRIAGATGTAQTFYHGDQLNSATTLTDATGNVLSRQVLSPFGRRLAASTDPVALAGVRLDSTGLYTMGAREMHPGLGVFITPDPSEAPDAEKPQTLNRYAYANNSPTNLVDLTGFAANPPDAPDGIYGSSVSADGQTIHTQGHDFTQNTSGTWDEDRIPIGLDAPPDPLVRPTGWQRAKSAVADGLSNAWDFAGEVASAVPATAGEAGAFRVLTEAEDDVAVARTAAQILAANRVAGKAAEAMAKVDLVAQGNKVLGSQVSVWTSTGLRVIDHLIQTPSGQIIAVEVKSGNAVRSASQLAKDAEMATKGAVPVGKNTPDFLRGAMRVIQTMEMRY